jgi:hypothetical protein
MDNGREGQPITLELVVDGTQVIGTFTALSKLPVKGEFKDGRLSLVARAWANGREGGLVFDARLTPEGTLDGTVNPHETGEFAWTATRKATRSPAPGSAGQVVKTSTGTVEFIGLETWTPEMIRQELAYGSTADLHYCAARLKSELGFAEASAVTYLGEGNYTVVSVVEAQHASRVQRREAPAAPLATPAEWQENRNGLETKSRWRSPEPWMRPVAARRTDRDFALALERLGTDGDHLNRAAAAAVLVNFPERAESWRALVEAMRDPSNYVYSESLSALAMMNRNAPPITVDWSASAASIRHILNGTNLFGLNPTMEALLKTNVDPALARDLLGNGGAMLLAYLGASHDKERLLAHRLLARLSGQDFGTDAARWQQWIASLSAA